jgi:hypothetical protein
MVIFVGIDWAEQHHDYALMNPDGQVVARGRVPEGIDGISRLHTVIADHADQPEQVVVGIETDRGLLVGSLIASGYEVFAVNPKAVNRYRDRHAVSGAKSDTADARSSPIWSAPTGITTGPSPATATWRPRSRSPPARIRV